MSWRPGKFAGRGKLKEGSLKENLFSGQVRTRRGIITAVNRAIKRAYADIRAAAIAWVNRYVPKDTGVLRAAFVVDPQINLASRQDNLVKMKLKMGFPAFKFPGGKPYAEYVDKMRGVHLTTPGTITPFWQPLQRYMARMVPQLLRQAFAAEGLRFNTRNMRVEAG